MIERRPDDGEIADCLIGCVKSTRPMSCSMCGERAAPDCGTIVCLFCLAIFHGSCWLVTGAHCCPAFDAPLTDEELASTSTQVCRAVERFRYGNALADHFMRTFAA